MRIGLIHGGMRLDTGAIPLRSLAAEPPLGGGMIKLGASAPWRARKIPSPLVGGFTAPLPATRAKACG